MNKYKQKLISKLRSYHKTLVPFDLFVKPDFERQDQTIIYTEELD